MLTIEIGPDDTVILKVAGLQVAKLTRTAWSHALAHPVLRGAARSGGPQRTPLK